MNEKINWWLVIVLSVIGVAAIVWGLALEDYASGAFSGLLIEIGAGVGLIGAVVLLERQLVSRISTAAAAATTETIRDATADLQERIVRLENLEEAQHDERSRRHSEQHAAINRVRGGELTAESVGELFLGAIEDRLIVDDMFRVRTSESLDCPILYFCVLSAPNGVAAIWLDFEPLMVGDYIVDVPDLGEMFVPNKTDSTVMWIYDDTAAEIGDQLEAGLERTNVPTNGFSFTYALTQLTRSVETMRTARTAPSDSPFRLQGQLQLLINDDWVLTTTGVEAIHSPTDLTVSRGISGWVANLLRLPDDFDEDADGWSGAASWLTDRERILILRGDEEPPNPFAGMLGEDQK